MASDARLSLPCRLPAPLPPPPALRRSPRAAAAAAAAASTSPRCRILTTAVPARPRASPGRWRALASEGEAQGQVQQQDDEVVDSNVLPYCSIDRKQKKTIGEMEQEFLQALQAFYYEQKAIMSNEEFDNLKEELMWEGSSVVMLSPDEQRFLEASMAYVAGNPIMTDAEFDDLKLRLKKEGSDIVQEGPRCSLRSRKVYSDLTVDYFKMFLLNVPAAFVALTLFFFLDDLTGFEITYLLELPEPYSFIFTWFAALPLIFWVAQSITNAIVKDFLILKGPCPNCGNENLSFFGTILSVPSGGAKNSVKCANCGTELVYDSASRLITLPELAEA
ncbi:PGR5-like protein 1A, chloroplastic [Panicum miliaceum]|uniref:PGR5-like protein 1A, chloroplastic n=1 Tax=Panicum miliaceum TaxID=4540 RepID=A0A3L6QL77_PANMI|nr:PGR5-like protein 1A, chloroplastic [Panicum miliaceum]